MLQKFRERILGWFGQIILAFIFITFSLWGVNAYFTTDTQNVVATVGEEEISLQEYRDTYLRMYQQRRDLFGDRFRPELINEEQLAEQALQSLVNQALAASHARDSGYRATDREVRQTIMDVPTFQSNGEFSRELYRVRLATQGLTAKGFEQQVREGLQTDQMQNAVQSSEFVLPYELENMVSIRDENRQYASVSIPAGRFYTDTVVTEDELRAYYEANLSSFMSTERVDLAYIELTRDYVADDVTVTEEMVRARYQQEADLFLDQEQRVASHILIDTSDGDEEALAEARSVMDRLRAGEDFAELAAEVSDDPGSAGEGGSLGLIQRGILVGPFEDTLFAMQQGEISEPVKTEFGYHIIRLDEIQAPQPKPFAEVRDEIEAQLQSEIIEQRFYDAAQRLSELAFENPESLSAAAQALDVEVQTQQSVTRTTQAGIAADSIVREAAFSDKVLGDRFNSDLLEIGENHVVILRVEDHHPAEVKPLADVREEVADRLRERQANEMARDLADNVMQRAQAGESLQQLADELLLPYTPPRTITRSRPGIPFDLADALFSAVVPSGNEPVYGITRVGANEYAVYSILSSNPGELANLTTEEREARKRQLLRQKSFYALGGFLEDQKQRIGVTRREGNLLDL